MPIWKDGFYYEPTPTTTTTSPTTPPPTQTVTVGGQQVGVNAPGVTNWATPTPATQPTNPTNAPNIPTPQVAGDATTNMPGTISNLQGYQQNYLNTLQSQPSAYDLYQQELKNRGIDTLTQQEADLSKSINAQEAALKPLLPENVAINFPKSLQQLQDVGVNQDQLNLLAAKERTPIASALSDLLKSQSAIAQQIDRQISFAKYAVDLKKQDMERQAQIAELRYNFAKELADGTALSQKEAKQFALENNITKPYYNIGGTVYRTSDGYAFTSESDFQTKEKIPVGTAQAQGLIQPASEIGAAAKPATSDIAEYEYAKSQGYKGTFQQWIAPTGPAGRRRSSGSSGSSVSSGGYKFTSTQLNKGASNAGLSLDEFKQLSGEDQNFYINNATALKDMKKIIDQEIQDNGREALGSLREEIDNSNLPQAAKEELKAYAESIAPPVVTKHWWEFWK